ncbi:hypothetical protein BCR35DRAFT_355917 [Leucosporidium creatinivorum]|uniref:Uncharacterized protein n=1 Tax=Leucosporidium creatinivorum TaxID=106004 RepID=A0A1Y2D6Q8_9BASI|nr:hypothetical protein BCR35DRAFT_355917 [Leucosporidium creatinivorum]
MRYRNLALYENSSARREAERRKETARLVSSPALPPPATFDFGFSLATTMQQTPDQRELLALQTMRASLESLRASTATLASDLEQHQTSYEKLAEKVLLHVAYHPLKLALEPSRVDSLA